MRYEQRLGQVESVFFGKEDHGILTCMLHIKFGVSHQGFGGYDLRKNISFITEILSFFDVMELSKICGKTVYALSQDEIIKSLKLPEYAGGKVFVMTSNDNWEVRDGTDDE